MTTIYADHVERLTPVELDQLARAVGTELQRRQARRVELRKGWAMLQRLDARRAAAPPKPKVVRIQTLTCAACGGVFEREARRGRPPKQCDPCRGDA